MKRTGAAVVNIKKKKRNEEKRKRKRVDTLKKNDFLLENEEATKLGKGRKGREERVTRPARRPCRTNK